MSGIEDLLGQVLTKVKASDDVMIFVTTSGDIYQMEHFQDCCESVYIESIVGDLDDLIGEPILTAEEVDNHDEHTTLNTDESYTWTFYKLATRKGYVDIRWYGTSNGYYSESVSFYKVQVE